MSEKGEGPDSFSGLALACAGMILLWGVAIGAYCLGRAAPDVHSEPVRQAKAAEVPKARGQ